MKRGRVIRLIDAKALTVGLAVGLLAGGGFAFAQSAQPGGAHDQGAEGAYQTMPDGEGTGPVATGEEAKQIVDYLEGRSESPHPKEYFVAEGAPPALVEQCRERIRPLDPLACEAVIAISAGELAPGSYSEEELREAVGE